MENMMKNQLLAGAVLVAAGMAVSFQAPACTGIGLKAKDGGYVMARTMEWSGPYVP
jgi:penicillin V acylase-like amidase (Ntn superfamily)